VNGCVVCGCETWSWCVRGTYGRERNKTLKKAAQSAFLSKYYWGGDRNKENKMGGTCGMHREEEKCVLGFGGEI
jgi:hypothetical protein